MPKKKPEVKIETPPKHQRPAWPPENGKPIQVVYSDGDSIVNLASRSNVKVRDILLFNFNTLKPEYINWYLANYLGCNVVSPDGHNLRFGKKLPDGAVEKVTIYLPYLDWEPEPDKIIPQWEPPPTNVLEAPDYKAMLIGTLRSHAIQKIQIGWKGYLIDSGLLRRVARLIEQDVIGVYLKKKNDGINEYDTKSNSFLLIPGLHDYKRGSMVHEAIHAGLDILKAHNLRRRDNEAVAHVGQCIWWQETFDDPEIRNLGSGTGSNDKIWDEAWKLAKRFRADEDIWMQDWQPLLDAITTSALYAEEAWNLTCFDGVFGSDL